MAGVILLAFFFFLRVSSQLLGIYTVRRYHCSMVMTFLCMFPINSSCLLFGGTFRSQKPVRVHTYISILYEYDFCFVS